ncbi:hypothetical protein BG011_006598 [Mortierella polycephala]|uniref:FAD-binding domain-containing protein n=1 Tax=Mortierella polycephala TaxID=41804 RepID=A0A9P6PU97_9FUNG|nr:hypothetical protein BG011_006598 [Mortierella polycephala]
MAPNPRIIIVGAGIAGLSLANMLECAGMHRYIILEKGAEFRPLGSAICLSAMMLRCFEQMGILPDIIEISKPIVGNVFLDWDLNFVGNLPGLFIGERYGYFNIIMTRPDFHRVLAKRVPAHKIYFSKKVLGLTQTNEHAQVRCSDNTIYTADIVIGADGAYSGIRQSLYKSIQGAPKRSAAKLEKKDLISTLKKIPLISPANHSIGSNAGGGGGVGSRGEPLLPKSDQASLRFDQHAVCGITNPLDPERYPFLKSKGCQVVTVLYKDGFSCWLFPVTQNRICWGIASRTFATAQEQANSDKSLPANFKVSEWGPEAVDELLNLDYVRNQKSPYGGTLSDLFDQTEKGTPIRIMFEDKAFKTWYYKRTVLVGDACHKLIPFSGVGAVHAILDCIVLVNAIYDMPDGEDFTASDINQAFQTYYAQRVESAAAAVKGSAQVASFVSGTGALSNIIRKATLASMPEILVSIAADRIFASRPILSFLPFVPDYGTRKSTPQPLGRRDREELELLREKERKEKEEAARKRKEERKRQGILKNGASRILKATSAASSSFDRHIMTSSASAVSAPSSSSSLPKHNFMDESTPWGDSRRSLSTMSLSSMSDSGEGSMSMSDQRFDGDSDRLSMVDTDTSSMFSHSDRYTLPYDVEELGSQYYRGRRTLLPYVGTQSVYGASNIDRRDSSGSLVSSLWRRYGSRSGSTVSMQSSAFIGSCRDAAWQREQANYVDLSHPESTVTSMTTTMSSEGPDLDNQLRGDMDLESAIDGYGIGAHEDDEKEKEMAMSAAFSSVPFEKSDGSASAKQREAQQLE